MRYSVLLLAALWASGCGPVPSLYIHHLKAGRTVERQNGERIKVKRLDADTLGSAQPGFFALKSEEDWQQFWTGSGVTQAASGIDYSRKMALIASTEAAGTQAIRVESVVEDGASMFVYVQATRSGEGCPARTEGAVKQDVVVLDRTEKPIHFYVESKASTSCGDAPDAEVACSINGQAIAGIDIKAQPGDVVECTARSEQRGVFAIADQQWSWNEQPRGSSAKLAYGKNGDKISFKTDLFGRYGLKFENRDDAGRRGEANVTVHVAPQDQGTFVQLLWTSFEPSDDPSTFPRIALELESLGEPAGYCAVAGDGVASWCRATKQSDTLQTISLGERSGSYKLLVHYTDDRFVGGPVACVRMFADGEQRGEVCDKEVRSADSEWVLGAFAGATAALSVLPEKAPEPEPEPAPSKAPGKTPSKPQGKGGKASTSKAGGGKSTTPKGSSKPVFRP